MTKAEAHQKSQEALTDPRTVQGLDLDALLFETERVKRSYEFIEDKKLMQDLYAIICDRSKMSDD